METLRAADSPHFGISGPSPSFQRPLQHWLEAGRMAMPTVHGPFWAGCRCRQVRRDERAARTNTPLIGTTEDDSK